MKPFFPRSAKSACRTAKFLQLRNPLKSNWCQFTVAESIQHQCVCHHHHHHREVLTDRCAPPWPLATSDCRQRSSVSVLDVVEPRAAGRPEGLVQVVDGFLPSWLFTISWRAAFADTLESRRAMCVCQRLYNWNFEKMKTFKNVKTFLHQWCVMEQLFIISSRCVIQWKESSVINWAARQI